MTRDLFDKQLAEIQEDMLVMAGSAAHFSGVLLFVVSSARQLPLNSLMANVWPFLLVQVTVLVLCVVYPPLVTWLPSVMFGR